MACCAAANLNLNFKVEVWHARARLECHGALHCGGARHHCSNGITAALLAGGNWPRHSNHGLWHGRSLRHAAPTPHLPAPQ